MDFRESQKRFEGLFDFPLRVRYTTLTFVGHCEKGKSPLCRE